MKKQWMLLILSFLFLPFFGLYANRALDNRHLSLRIIEVQNLTEEEFYEVMIRSEENCIFQFSQGMVFPVEMFLKGDFFSFLQKQEKPINVRILKTFYLRAHNDDLLFSQDLHVWKPLLEFFAGQVSVQVGFAEALPYFHLDFTVNKRL